MTCVNMISMTFVDRKRILKGEKTNFLVFPIAFKEKSWLQTNNNKKKKKKNGKHIVLVVKSIHRVRIAWMAL